MADSNAKEMPGEGAIAGRPLHFIWICDVSYSMEGTKIESLNFSVEESIPAMRDAAADNPRAQVLVRVLKFSDGAQWVFSTPVKVEEFTWTKLGVEGSTSLGKALSMVADQMKMPPMEERGLPPVLVLISDGQPTDDWRSGLDELLAEPWGKRAIRVAIGMGDDVNMNVLQEFIAFPAQERPALKAGNARDLINYIQWASTVPLKASSQPPSTPKGEKLAIPLPAEGAQLPAGVDPNSIPVDLDSVF